MKFYSFPFLLLLLTINCYAQDTIQNPVQDTIHNPVQSPLEFSFMPVKTLNKTPTDLRLLAKKPTRFRAYILSHWKKKNSVGFDLSQIAFVNWNAGGTSSIAGLLKGNFTRIRSEINSEWVNELSFRYGLNKQDGIEVRKSDDEFRLNSTYGYRKDTISHWYFSCKFNFKTQFAPGYKYPNVEDAISKPFAPAYTFLGIGADYYVKKKKFDIYISPLTFKNTLVLDQDLADSGAFGLTEATYDANGNLITHGKKSRTEMGILFTNYYIKEVWKNITLENRLSLYTDYLNNFGNIDVEWRAQLDLVVNQYVKANIGLHLIYDDDVKTIEEVNGQDVESGAKVQLRQALGVGMVYNF